jgi:hypothetical protein
MLSDIVVPSRISHELSEIILGEGAEKFLPHAFTEVLSGHVNLSDKSLRVSVSFHLPHAFGLKGSGQSPHLSRVSRRAGSASRGEYRSNANVNIFAME